MSSTNEEDPFLQVQADVLSLLNTTRPLFSSYLRIRSLASSPTSPELTQARSELESSLQDLTADLKDLVESVRAIEHDPYRFGLELDEVARRRRLVEEVGGEVEDMREELAKAVATAATAAANATSSSSAAYEDSGGRAHPSSGFDNANGNDDYAAFEQQQQLEMMNEQDQALDGVFQTVGNLRQQADDMGRELEEQGGLLDDVDTLADRVGGRLQTGIKKVGHVIKQNEGKVCLRL
ncbi:MAG: hypothetical protein M1825_001661 [Sarcosagium campestre]|nr:MAG: hypothetical protein M1825_001661 [Sarcosagium campestre]